jgi:hypothetical protein
MFVPSTRNSSGEIFKKATECVERLPGPGNLERAMGILAQGGVALPRIRDWAVEAARSYGILEYVAPDFERMMARVARAEA